MYFQPIEVEQRIMLLLIKITNMECYSVKILLGCKSSYLLEMFCYFVDLKKQVLNYILVPHEMWQVELSKFLKLTESYKTVKYWDNLRTARNFPGCTGEGEMRRKRTISYCHTFQPCVSRNKNKHWKEYLCTCFGLINTEMVNTTF